MANLSQFFKDGDGQFSATRLGFLAWVIGVLVAWIAASAAHKELASVPESVAAILGVLMTGKVVQTFGENLTPPVLNPPTPVPPVVPTPVVNPPAPILPVAPHLQ